MSIMNVSNLFNGKNAILVKNTTSQPKDRPPFSEVLNKQNTSNNGYNTNNNSKKETNPADVCNKVCNNQSEVSNKDTNKLYSKETKQLETDKDIGMDIEKNIEKDIENENPVENLEDRPLDDIIALLQNLFVNIPVDAPEIENESKLNVDLINIEVKNLVNLKDQLSLLVDTMSFEEEQSLVESIKETLSILTDIIDEASLTDSNVILIEKENISKILSNLVDFKDSIDLTLNNINSTENEHLQILDINKKNDLVDVEEEKLSKNDEISTNTIDTSQEDNISIENLDKSTSSDHDDNPNLFNKNDGQEYIPVNDNILVSQQEKIDQSITVSVVKNEIVEPKQFINEISQKASAFLSKDKNEMSIQLTPENLGKISIKIGLNDGTLTGKIYAENYSVKEIIEANLNQLRDALEKSGLNIAGLDVNVGDNSQNFGNSLFQQRMVKKQNTKGFAGAINNGFVTLEQDINKKNPYLVSNQFDGLI